MTEKKSPWTTCVVLSYKPRTLTDGGWWATVKWSWGRFCDPEMVEGEIRTRYPTGMRRAIDQVMELVEQFGVEVAPHLTMGLYVEGDGENESQLLPVGWRDRVRREAKRREWESYSQTEKEEA